MELTCQYPGTLGAGGEPVTGALRPPTGAKSAAGVADTSFEAPESPAALMARTVK